MQKPFWLKSHHQFVLMWWGFVFCLPQSWSGGYQSLVPLRLIWRRTQRSRLKINSWRPSDALSPPRKTVTQTMINHQRPFNPPEWNESTASSSLLWQGRLLCWPCKLYTSTNASTLAERLTSGTSTCLSREHSSWILSEQSLTAFPTKPFKRRL